MKNVSRFAATLIIGAASLTVAKADDPATQAAQAPTSADNMALQDPDGTPLVFTHPKSNGPSQEEIDAEKKRQQKANADKDWLLNSYEQQLQLRAAKDGSENNNLYLRIASDKTLSKLAGIQGIDTPLDTKTALKTGPTTSGQSSLALRPNAAAPQKGITSNLFTPLITPLGAADAAGLHNFYGSMPTAPAPPSRKADPDKNSADYDMPGKVAADSDPLTKARLTFEGNLPDDILPDKDTHANAIPKDVLPSTTNAQQMQKITDTALNVPGSVKTVAPVKVTNMQAETAPDDAPAKLTAPSSRPAIANPYSILDH